MHYNIETSLFDVVIAAAIRFLLLSFFYGMMKINHWIIIALTTSFSCGFLIFKVFWYIWPSSQQPVFQVLLIICSFVISWFEAWFLDSRVIPQEEYSRTLTSGKALNWIFVVANLEIFLSLVLSSADSRTALLPQFMNTIGRGSILQAPESYRNFYSPVESDDEVSDID